MPFQYFHPLYNSYGQYFHPLYNSYGQSVKTGFSTKDEIVPPPPPPPPPKNVVNNSSCNTQFLPSPSLLFLTMIIGKDQNPILSQEAGQVVIAIGMFHNPMTDTQHTPSNNINIKKIEKQILETLSGPTSTTVICAQLTGS